MLSHAEVGYGKSDRVLRSSSLPKSLEVGASAAARPGPRISGGAKANRLTSRDPKTNCKQLEEIMAATVAFTDLEGIAGSGFPPVTEHADPDLRHDREIRRA